MTNTAIILGAIAFVALTGAGRSRLRAADLSSLPHPDVATIRHTKEGDVIGYKSSESNTFEWRGIPYAEPPVGEFRWRAPQDPKPWTGIRNAIQFASACSQATDEELVLALYGRRITAADYVARQRYQGGEDCLYLNIDTPRFAPGKVPRGRERLPVMVYFHGGGNVSGSGFFPGALAAKENVITIAPNYRLGHFGWFSHPALTSGASSEADRSGNYGTLDQIRALRWVRDNVAAFGGDPDNITVFGISAGGSAVLTLVSSPKAAGLFQRAIAMSGITWTRTVEQASSYIDKPMPEIPASSGELLLRLLITDGRAANREQAKTLVANMLPKEIAAYLQSKSYPEFNHADALIAGENALWWAGEPIADGAVIPTEGVRASYTYDSQHNHVAFMAGATHDDAQPYVLADGRFADLTIDGAAGPEYRIKDRRTYRLASEYMSLLWNADGAQEPASALVRYQPEEVFAYQLAWHEVLPWPGPDGEARGAIHSQDLALIFGWPPATEMTKYNYRYVPPVTKQGIPSYLRLAQTMMSYWAEFAYTGRPGRGRNGELPEWRSWAPQPGAPKYMILDSDKEGGLRMSSEFVTKTDVLSKLEHDSRLPGIETKCQFLNTLYSHGTRYGGLTSADLQSFASGACAGRSGGT